MKTFVLAMVLHPEVYRKAQEEIDRVVGPERLPDFEDREQLPYLECLLKEVYRCVDGRRRTRRTSCRACAHPFTLVRWNAPVPLGESHSSLILRLTLTRYLKVSRTE